MDGLDEVLLADAGQVVTVDLDGGAGIGGWDIRAVRHALTAVMRRRPEAYHETLRALDRTTPKRGRHDAPARRATAAASVSIHDIVRVKEAGLAARLVYDAYERRSGLVRSSRSDATPEDWATAPGDRARRPRRRRLRGRRSSTTGRLSAGRDATARGRGRSAVVEDADPRWRPARPDARPERSTLEHRATAPIDGAARRRVGADDARRRRQPGGLVGRRRRADRHDASGQAAELSTIARATTTSAYRVDDDGPAPADAWWAPIETISNSEAGFERVYQGSALLLSWPLAWSRGERWTRTVTPRRRDRPATARRGPPRERARSLVVHGHFYQPLAARSVHRARCRATRPPRRSTTGTSGSAPSATGPTPSAATSAGSRGTSGRRWRAGSSDGDPTPIAGSSTATPGGNGMAQAFHHTILPLASAADRRTEIRWGLRDFELRFGRPAGRVLAARDGRRPGDAAAARRRGRRRTRSSRRGRSTADRARHAAAVPRRRSAAAARSSSRSTTPACRRPSRSSPPRPATRTGSPASGSCPALARAACPTTTPPLARHRDRRRAVRPPPAVPRPVPAAARRPRPAPATTVATSSARRRRRASAWPRRSGRHAASSARRGAATTASPAGRRLPVRRRRRLEGPAAGGARAAGRRASTPRPSAGAGLPGAPDPWAARDAYVDVVVGARAGAAFARALARRRGADGATGTAPRRCSRPSAGASRCSPADGWFWEDPARIETAAVRCGPPRGRPRLVDDLAGTDLERGWSPTCTVGAARPRDERRVCGVRGTSSPSIGGIAGGAVDWTIG